jgi:hypothetical protein
MTYRKVRDKLAACRAPGDGDARVAVAVYRLLPAVWQHRHHTFEIVFGNE